jgi:[ribosomal protein S5]-alanine N-acetyltransferase
MSPLRFTPFPQLSTERLMLRELKAQDAPEIFLLRSDPVVNKHLERPKAKHIDEAKAFIEKINQAVEKDESIFWAICPKDRQSLAGTICLWNFANEKKRAEIGYELLPAFHNKGIMQEAFLAVLNYGFKILQLEVIEAWTVAANVESIKILERNHFKRDFELEARIDRYVEGEDRVIYSLSKDQFNLQFSFS